MKDLRTILRVMLVLGRLLVWAIVTVWLGAVAVIRLLLVLSRWRRVFGSHLHCARGHATPAYGVFECRCGALVEDWVFAKCRVCGSTAGWTPCTSCGLPIRNPLLV
jgi:hypothetical protein